MLIKRFEDLEVWKNSRLLSQKVREISINSHLSKDYALKDQISRSIGSVMDNIAEGFERDGKKEFIQFLYIAKGSLGETRSQLARCFDAKYITEEQSTDLMNDCLNLSGQIKKFINYLSSSEIQGNKKR